jgi:hypothetical protein
MRSRSSDEDGDEAEDESASENVEDEGSNVVEKKSALKWAEREVLGRRSSTAELRVDRGQHDDLFEQAQKMGDLLFEEPSYFNDAVGFLYLVDLMGSAKGHRPFLSRVEEREDDWGDYSALVLQVVRDAPRLPDDWTDSLVVVADFGDSILVATRTGVQAQPKLNGGRTCGCSPCVRAPRGALMRSAYSMHLNA